MLWTYKKCILPVSTILGVLDHNANSNRLFILSVFLKLKSFKVQVTVTLQDSVLQPSSPFHHAADMEQLLHCITYNFGLSVTYIYFFQYGSGYAHCWTNCSRTQLRHSPDTEQKFKRSIVMSDSHNISNY